MNDLPKKLIKRLETRIASNSLRKLSQAKNLVDFSSNDYLGFSKAKDIFHSAHQFLVENNLQQNGATGSRLLSGNHDLHGQVEGQLAPIFKADTALLFNSGYDANIGLFSSVPQKGDLVLYDEFIHASIRDGIKMSNANSFKFKHNDLDALEKKLIRYSELVSESPQKEIYVVTESVFSMDGDSPDLVAMSQMLKNYKAHLIVDEAHAIGVLGENGCGLIQELELEKDVFARVVTFGKAMGCHGAAILGSESLKQYLINFARSFIYTTAIPLHSVATVKFAFEQLVILSESEESHPEIQKLRGNIKYFKEQLATTHQQLNFIKSNSAIHCCIISGNEKVKSIAQKLQENGFDVKPILSPTVPEGEERLRICLHSYNSRQEIEQVLNLLLTFV